MSSLDGKTVLITGSGAGLGQGVAIAAAKAGAHVIVTSLSDNGAETKRLIEEAGGKATWVKCDVTDRAAVDNAVEESVRVTGRLDGMVHNAFARPMWEKDPRVGSVSKMTMELWQHEASVALRGAYYCATASYPHLRDARAG